MPTNVNEKIAVALNHLGASLHPDKGAISACLRALDDGMRALEVGDMARMQFAVRVIDSLSNLPQPTRREVVAALQNALAFSNEVRNVLGHDLNDDLNVPVSSPEPLHWDLKELDNRLPRTRKDASHVRPFFGNTRPVSNRLPRWNRFDARPEDTSRDHHAANIGRESVERMLRSLGHGSKDFGPEPPMGGQPALR